MARNSSFGGKNIFCYYSQESKILCCSLSGSEVNCQRCFQNVWQDHIFSLELCAVPLGGCFEADTTLLKV